MLRPAQARRQVRQRRRPSVAMYVFSGVQAWPSLQCIRGDLVTSRTIVGRLAEQSMALAAAGCVRRSLCSGSRLAGQGASTRLTRPSQSLEMLFAVLSIESECIAPGSRGAFPAAVAGRGEYRRQPAARIRDLDRVLGVQTGWPPVAACVPRRWDRQTRRGERVWAAGRGSPGLYSSRPLARFYPTRPASKATRTGRRANTRPSVPCRSAAVPRPLLDRHLSGGDRAFESLDRVMWVVGSRPVWG